MTVRDLISGSLRLIGVVASGETLSANEQSDALNALNDLLDSWSTESLVVFDRPREEFALVSGQQVYTMGVGGNFNTSRPQLIEAALIKDQTITPPFEFKMEILNLQKWEEISVKSVQSTFPTKLYADNANPLVNVNVWPAPNTIKTLVLYSMKPISSFASVATTISLPPGYQRALRYNLAIELAPEYGKSVSQEVASVALTSKANIERMNIRPTYLDASDPTSGVAKPFNWITGE